MMEALSKEYGWLPSEIKNESYADIQAYWKILAIKRRLEKAQIDKAKRKR